MPSKRLKNFNTEDDEEPRRSIWLAYSAFNPSSMVPRGPRSSFVFEAFLANYPTARMDGQKPQPLGATVP